MLRIHLDDVESLPVLDGELQWKPVRHVLGIDAFGINAYHGAEPGDLVVEEHEDDHQELYVVMSGRARFRSADDEFDASAGTLVLFAPREHRVAHAVEAGTTVLAIGAESARFEPSPWEYGFSASGLTDLGRYDEARAAIDEGRARHPAVGFHFSRARLSAAQGEIEHLRLAAETDSTALERARNDRLLGPLVL